MNRKLIALLAIVVFAISSFTVLASTVISAPVHFQFEIDPAVANSGVSLSLCSDCACTLPLNGMAAHDFGVVMSGNTYQWTFYVLNNGSQQVYLTFLPGSFLSGNTVALVNVSAIAYGDACQTSGTTLAPPLASNALPYYLPVYNSATPSVGFLLLPDKVVKLDVNLIVTSVDANANSFSVPLTIDGSSVTLNV